MKIKDFCTFAPKSKIKAGQAIKDGQYMFFTSSKDENKRYIDYLYDGEGIIMGTGGNATLHYYKGKYAVSTDCVVLNPDERIRCKYLYYFFLANMAILEAGFKGAGLKHTNRKYIENIVVSKLPTFDEQDSVIKILDKISDIIRFRNLELKVFDNLIKARFVEMFGDPIRNEKGWCTKALEAICKLIVDCPHSTPKYTSENTGFMCIRTSIVKKNRIEWKDIEYISEKEYKQRIQRKKPEKGDIIYTREGAILGIAAVIDRDCNVALGQRSMLLSPNKKICTSEFLSVAMNFDSFLDKVLKGVSGTASPHINVGSIKVFKMILPPIEQQEKFSSFVHQVDKSKVAIQKSLDETQLLFDSLMQKYFK